MSAWAASPPVLAAITIVSVALASLVARRDAFVSCRDGLIREGSRCCSAVDAHGTCTSRVGADSFATTDRVLVDHRLVALRGQSFERPQVETQSVQLAPFFLARTEVRCADALAILGSDASEITRELCRDDANRAAGGLRFSDAERICRVLGGRVPTETEWQRAAGARGTRYPWGETGATCRAAVWGMTRGPCAHGNDGPDTVHARPGGASLDDLVDLAGNAAEWVQGGDGSRVLKGGDYASLDASELRVFARRRANTVDVDPRNGARCAFDPSR